MPRTFTEYANHMSVDGWRVSATQDEDGHLSVILKHADGSNVIPLEGKDDDGPSFTAEARFTTESIEKHPMTPEGWWADISQMPMADEHPHMAVVDFLTVSVDTWRQTEQGQPLTKEYIHNQLIRLQEMIWKFQDSLNEAVAP